MARVQTSRRNCRRAVMVAPWVSSRRRRQIRYTLEARRFGEVAESAEGSRLLSGYRGKTSVPGSNPGLSANTLDRKHHERRGILGARGEPMTRPLLLLFQRHSGGLRSLVVLGFRLRVLARLMERPGFRRELLRGRGGRVGAVADRLVDLGLQHRALSCQCRTSGRSDQ